MAHWTGTITKTVNDVDRHVKRQFGDESGVQITTDDIIRWINAGQREIVAKNGLLRAESTLTATPGTWKYTFPLEGVLKVQSLRYNNRTLRYLTFQEAEDYVTDSDPQRTSTGDPIIWSEWAGNIQLYPTPSSSGELSLYYIKNPVEVSVVGDLLSVPDNYYNRLVEYVMSQAYELDDDWTGVGNKLQQFEAGMNVLAGDDESSYANVYPSITMLDEDYS